MAYTPTITKQSVTKQGSFYNISLRVVINDGAEDVLDFDISTKYNPNAPDLSAVQADLQNQMLDQWNKYIDNQSIFTAQALDTVVSDLQTAANNYINS